MLYKFVINKAVLVIDLMCIRRVHPASFMIYMDDFGMCWAWRFPVTVIKKVSLTILLQCETYKISVMNSCVFFHVIYALRLSEV